MSTEYTIQTFLVEDFCRELLRKAPNSTHEFEIYAVFKWEVENFSLTESSATPRTVISVSLTEASTGGGVILQYRKYYSAAVSNVVPLLLQTLSGIRRKLEGELERFKMYHGTFRYSFESAEWISMETLLYVDSLTSGSSKSEVLRYEMSKIFDDIEIEQVEEESQKVEDVLAKVRDLLKES